MALTDRGLYELLITEAIEAQLHELGGSLEAVREALRAAEAADRIALHIGRVVQRAIEAIGEDGRSARGTELARQIVELIRTSSSGSGLDQERPIPQGEILRSIVGRLPDGSQESIEHPLIPLLDTTLLTNAPGEPRVGSQVLAEIHSADRIDVVMAFIRRTGIAPLIPALRAHCQAGRELRILTTTYTGSTEQRALEQLRDLGGEVRVSYDTSSTRLHAKAWLFYRSSGFSTAYIGSSNLTHSAQVVGLEWNVRVSGARNAGVIDKVSAVFESYWQQRGFQTVRPRGIPGANERRAVRRVAYVHPCDGVATGTVSRATARATGPLAPARAPPELAGGGHGDREDRHGGPRLRGTARELAS